MNSFTSGGANKRFGFLEAAMPFCMSFVLAHNIARKDFPWGGSAAIWLLIGSLVAEASWVAWNLYGGPRSEAVPPEFMETPKSKLELPALTLAKGPLKIGQWGLLIMIGLALFNDDSGPTLIRLGLAWALFWVVIQVGGYAARWVRLS